MGLSAPSPSARSLRASALPLVLKGALAFFVLYEKKRAAAGNADPAGSLKSKGSRRCRRAEESADKYGFLGGQKGHDAAGFMDLPPESPFP